MANVVINETNLTNIANAIREKNGTEETYKPSEMAEAISAITTGGGGDFTDEQLTFTGDCDYLFGNPQSAKLILTSNNLSRIILQPSDFKYGLQEYEGSDLSDLTIRCTSGNTLPGLSYAFYGSKLKTFPHFVSADGKDDAFIAGNNIYGRDLDYAFALCDYMREVPSFLYKITDGSKSSFNRLFYGCNSLRSLGDLDWTILTPGRHSQTENGLYGDPITRGGFGYCSSLDEIKNIVIPYHATEVFTLFFVYNCFRLKSLTFSSESTSTINGTLDLSNHVGWVSDYGSTSYSTQRGYILNYNSGITADKEVKDNATYQALKNDPDWFTGIPSYSRYNRTSAVETINSLPTVTTSPTIKFKGPAGSKTDGGAINTMTEEEIAVATAKGWTVTFVD